MKTIRWQMVMEAQGEYPDAPKMTGPADVARLMKEQGHTTADRERFVVYLLNVKHQIIASEMVSMGILDGALIHPREVFKAAIVASAAGLIVAHNHPSGDVTPSGEDKAVARRLREAGTLLGIPLVDFLVVSPLGTFFSFKDDGII
ncbi:MAG: JAB domain-containing protein [Candidatus Peribacteraceae bacterium]